MTVPDHSIAEKTVGREPKKIYQPPVIIPLGELVRGSGNCTNGSLVVGGGGNCKSGAAVPVNNCINGGNPNQNCNQGGNKGGVFL